MSRKSKTVLLCLLGAVATLGVCSCCSGWWDELQGHPAGHGGHGGGGVHSGGWWWHSPRTYFVGGGPTHIGGPSGVGGSTTSRGGFGATGAASGGHGIGA